MSRFRWSRLYPSAWRKEFGEEFDAMLESHPVGGREAMDILLHALKARLSASRRLVPFVFAWGVICFLNIVAKEVQWPAGALLLCSGIATAWRPKGWLKHPFLFALAIPLSSLYFYQIPNIHHEPLYKTAVAFLPALVGSLMGLVVGLGLGEVGNHETA